LWIQSSIRVCIPAEVSNIREEPKTQKINKLPEIETKVKHMKALIAAKR
jgi:hypothetical protein